MPVEGAVEAAHWPLRFFLRGNPYAHQTWAKGLDDRGRPVRVPNMGPNEEGIKVYPGAAGANNWYSPAYSPKTDLFYVAVREAGGVYYKGEAEYKPGALFNGGGFRDIFRQLLAVYGFAILFAYIGIRRFRFDQR